MAFNYAPLAAEARSIIENFGRPVVFRRKEAALINPSEPWLGSAPDLVSTQPATAAFVDFTMEQRAASSNVQQRDQQLIVAAQGLTEEITTAFEVVDTDDVWQIIEVLSKVRPGDTTLVYIFQVRL